MNDDEIRKQVINYVESRGIKYTYIATKICVHKSTLSHFMKNDRKVADKVSKNLQEFLLNNK
ncbi:hypothetical protein AGR56_13810 [Clostridium sp. DMHC 10]|uniref:hypothetical protein n=1 Tax=Clostridium sp. DMHC 10 TaxID=747377 RepID=UPI00069E73ED|nr:hypothetical protein [Clostridium sp. DMHC 10]KOF57457.1 hypothetical protein AGR56_13810 [Clostridium sp. DMHC 10]